MFQKNIITKAAVVVLHLCIILGFVVFAFYSMRTKDAAQSYFINTAYYLIFSLFLAWIFQIFLFLKSINFSLSRFMLQNWLGILVALVMTVVVFVSTEVKFKILSDEANLLSVSKSMVDNKNCLNVTQVKYYYKTYNSVDVIMVPNKPLSYPFLVHIVHLLTGYRYQNGFVLNFILLWFLLTGVYVFVKSKSDDATALSGIFFILSYPVVALYSTCACYDFMSCVFFFLIMALTYSYIKNPTSSKFGLILVSLVVFANIRYESIFLVFLLPILLVLKIRWKFIKDNLSLLCVMPFFWLPYIWPKIINTSRLDLAAKDDAMLSISAFVKFSKIFLSKFTVFDNDIPYSNALNIAAVVICLFLIFQLLIKKIKLKKYQLYFIIVFFLSVLAHLVIVLASFFGRYDHAVSVRYFLIFSVSCALVPVALPILKPKLVQGKYLLLISIACFLFYHSVSVHGSKTNKLFLPRRVEHCINFLNKLDDKNILIITPRPVHFVPLGYGAVGVPYANANRRTILYSGKRHLYSKIIVFQKIEYKTNKPSKDTNLHLDYNLRTLQEIQLRSTYYLRISEVVINDL